MSAKDKINDFQTPKDVAKYMVNMLPDDIDYVLEPTPGLGTIVNELQLKDITVAAPRDYFLMNHSLKFPAVVMNPPFSKPSCLMDNAPLEYQNLKGMSVGYQFLFDCMQKSDIIIALMPWYTISDSDVRMRSIKKFGLKSITALPRKTFQYARIQTCILELRRGWTADTLFHAYEFMYDGKGYQEPMLNPK